MKWECEHISVRNERRSGERFDLFFKRDANEDVWTVSLGIDFTMFQFGFDLVQGGVPTSLRVACGPFYITIGLWKHPRRQVVQIQ